MDALSARVKYLLHVYTDGIATPAERDELMEIIRTPGHEGTIEETIAAEMTSLENAGEEMRRPTTEERAAEILSNILRSPQQTRVAPTTETRIFPSTETVMAPHEPVRKKTRLIWAWRAAAAALIIMAGVNAFRSYKDHQERPVAGIQKRSLFDRTPGGNKAVLLLANGSTIVLDSAHAGKLTQQGDANVMKLDNGRLAYTSLNSNSNTVLYNTLTTPRGGQYQLTLPDGSRVWLNAASSIRYPTAFIGTDRKVEITGEAYFEIEKDDRKPFVVVAGETRTTVLGTHFNINAYEDEKTIRTTLLEGAVRFSSGKEDKILRPGQQVMLNDETRSLEVLDADTYQAVAWKNGQIDLDNTDLPSIMRQISRWYDVDVDYRSKYEGARFGGGISRQLNLSEVLRLLDKSGIHTKLEDGKLIVLP